MASTLYQPRKKNRYVARVYAGREIVLMMELTGMCRVVSLMPEQKEEVVADGLTKSAVVDCSRKSAWWCPKF